ncbi:MAG: transporter substrate-binding domain-containing protein [Desulfatibacillum sp.]|nr:transporter substrate-binding domain-containing protein [Desulfatibacillum sp.]
MTIHSKFSSTQYPISFAIFLTFLALFLFWGDSVCAAEFPLNRTPIITSGSEIDYPPFCSVDEDGRAMGFSVELMRAALKSMGRDVTFRTGPWAEVKQWLEQGEVQALPLVGRTPEREDIFDFTFPYMSLHGAIVVRKDSTDIRDMKDLKGREVAVMKGDNAEEFLRRKNLGINIHTTDTFQKALDDLSQGRYDAVVIQRLVALRLIQETGLTNLQIVNQPIVEFRQDWSFAVKEGDRDTLALLNEGLALVMADGTYRHLHAKWFAALELHTNRRIIVGGDYNYPPYEFLDENGQPAGFNVDLTRAIAREMGLDIEIRLGPWSEAVEELENGRIDALQGMFYSTERDLKFDFTPPHTMNHYVSAVRKGEGAPPATMEKLKDKRIVIQKGDIIYDYALKHGLTDQLSLVETQEDALKAVAEGKYYCALSSRVTALYLIKKNKWTSLDLGHRPLLSTEYCYAVPNNHKALLAQFSEGLKILEETGEYRRIHNKWLGIYEESHTNLSTILRYVAMAAVPLFLLVLASFLWSWSLRKQVAVRTAELIETQALLGAAMDNSQAGIAIAEAPGGALRYVNDAGLLIRGGTRESMVNGVGIDQYVASWNLLDLDGRPLAADEVPLARAIQFGETCSREFIIRRMENDDRIVWANASPVTNTEGNVTAGIVVFLDITERKRAEEELRQRESQYNAIVENSGDYIMRYDRNHRHIFANHKAIESTGLPPAQFLGKTYREMGFPGHLCELWEKNIDEVFATGEVRLIEFDIESHDGWITLELQMNPEFGEGGVVQSVIGVSRDITERKGAQREDRLNKMRLEIIHIVQNMVDASEKEICDIILEKMVALLDSEIGFLGFITDDEQVMHIHAWSSAAMEKCAIQDKPITFPIDQAGLWGEPVRNRKAIIFNDYSAPHPAKKGYPEGHIAVSRFMSVPVFDGGRIVLVAAVSNKLNPYNEADLNQLSLLMSGAWEQIQRRRMEKEKEFLIVQLQKAQRMESIGNLAGGIAHDFNNLLSPIVGMSELLLEDLPEGSNEHENAREIFIAGKRASDLVKQILAFSRQSEQTKIPVRVQQVLKEVLKLSRSTIPSDIDISHDIQMDCGLVMADPTQIHQIVMNLITNAYHAMDQHGGKIDVELKETVLEAEDVSGSPLAPGKYAVMRISDTGSGIDPGIMDQIFEPYFTTKAQGKGTGLGLAVAYGIIKEHNGDVRVYSEVGKGTTFTIYLPLMEKTIASIPIELIRDDPKGNERILLVDDEEPVVRLEKQMLERLGYHVTERTSSSDALKAFQANPSAFDLVISDMTMPHMTGDLLALKLISIRPDIPIIICTGFSERINKENAEAAGIKGLLMKPIIRSEMAQMIRSVLDEAKGLSLSRFSIR